MRRGAATTSTSDNFDFLVNNGGMQIAGWFAQVSEHDLDQLIDVHFKGVGSGRAVSGSTRSRQAPSRRTFGGGIVRDNPQIAERIASITALKRTAVADDVVPPIASLLGDDDHWVTGQRIKVSGGMQL